MSENSGSKPKPVSLKDRIAAFNQQAAAQAAPSPPRPAPSGKPVQWAWKQKQAELAANTPPSLPPADLSPRAKPEATHEVDERGDKKFRMSASDAKESIKGTSLKERMAALQNQGGFGASAPKPIIPEKPKPLKNPPVVSTIISPQPVSSIAEGGGISTPSLPAEESATFAVDDAVKEAGVEEDDEEDDEEEKERQRRAAIAARMAKLGGARFGMGPSAFGRPAVKTPPAQSTPADLTGNHSSSQILQSEDTPEFVPKLPLPGIAPLTSHKEAPTSEDASSNPPPERKSSSSSESKSPPLSVPRRALPPRKKAQPKAPETDPVPVASGPGPEPESTPANVEDETDPSSNLIHDVGLQGVSDDVGLISKLSAQAEATELSSEPSRPTSSSAPELGLPPHVLPPGNIILSAALGGAISSVSLDEAESAEDPVQEDEHSTQETVSQRIASPVPGEADNANELKPPVPPAPARRSLPPVPPPTKADGVPPDSPASIRPPSLRQNNDGEAQEDEWDIGPSPGLRAVSPPPQPAPNAIPANEETEEQSNAELHVEEISPQSPAVNRSTRPPSIPLATRPTVSSPQSPASPTSILSNTKRSSVQSIPSRSTSLDAPLPPVSTKPARRTTLPPPQPTITQDPESLGADREYMNEGDTDPIDPHFFSPGRPNIPAPSHPQPPPARLSSEALPSGAAKRNEDPAEDDGSQHRKNIAERMARLGGLNFGPPAPPPVRREPPEVARTASNDGSLEEHEETEEEARARRAAIAARLASQGGLRFGMLTGAEPSGDPAERGDGKLGEGVAFVPEGSLTSDDGVKAEVPEGSETEELDDEVPNPPNESALSLPSESGDPLSKPQAPPPLPPGRPGRHSSILGTARQRRASYQWPAPSPPPHSSTPIQDPGEYVIVDGPQTAPSPPPRPTRAPSNRRSLPPPPPPATTLSAPTGLRSSDLTSSQWELPTIPTSSLGLDGDHNDDDTVYPSASVPSPPPEQSPASAKSQRRQTLNGDELMAVWGRVGTQVLVYAESLVEKSKKVVIGDGSAEGFVHEVLAGVPQAAKSDSFGHLVFVQVASTIQKRSSDIMPGDVIVLEDAKFKGHKGLSGYSNHVGVGGTPLVGIIHEFEPKKSKVRVYRAVLAPNQYPSVESVSYKLEDLKSGSVQVYRVASL